MLNGLFRNRTEASTTPGAFRSIHGLDKRMPERPGVVFRADAINPVRNPSNGQY